MKGMQGWRTRFKKGHKINLGRKNPNAGRPKKNKTKTTRIRADVLELCKIKAKEKGMSLPDYLKWRLS